MSKNSTIVAVQSNRTSFASSASVGQASSVRPQLSSSRPKSTAMASSGSVSIASRPSKSSQGDVRHEATATSQTHTENQIPTDAPKDADASVTDSKQESSTTSQGTTQQITQETTQRSVTESPTTRDSTTSPTTPVAQNSINTQLNAQPPESTSSSQKITLTITDQPESTFRTPFSIVVTNSANGKTALSFPPLVTVVSSSNSDGMEVTFTHVIANPTGVVAGLGASASSSSFLHNDGVIAGVFLVVGIVVTSLMVLAFYACKRRRRDKRRQRWISEIQRPLPLPQDPFEDPRDPPVLPIAHSRGSEEREQMKQMDAPSLTTHLEPPAIQPLSILRNRQMETPESLPHNAHVEESRLSPSIYSTTLPDSGKDSFYEDVDTSYPQAAPPRPPRSHLRTDSAKITGFPLTPPGSVSSHSALFSGTPSPPSPNKPMPDVGSQESPSSIFGRRTLLDIRPRGNTDYMGEAY